MSKTIIHKSKQNFEPESEKKIKDLLQSEVALKLKFLNTIQQQKFPQLQSELTNGCIIYKFPLRPQDYRYIYNGKRIPRKYQTLSNDNLKSNLEQNESGIALQNSDNIDFLITNPPEQKRFSIHKSISTIQQEIEGLTNPKRKVYQNNIRRESGIALMPRFFLRKQSNQQLGRNQSFNGDTKISLRIRSISQMVSQQLRPLIERQNYTNLLD